ncbi:hypothetical protein R3P38DRAFT_3237976 [Favolaschia claudopus]|uniref:Uncharacterized protein n=1 Tax=Favolaschia claudopus TaxID=2862362 RepID=A0AAV9ZAV6_9AGAR
MPKAGPHLFANPRGTLTFRALRYGRPRKAPKDISTLPNLRKFHVTFLDFYRWLWTNTTMPGIVDLKIATYIDDLGMGG